MNNVKEYLYCIYCAEVLNGPILKKFKVDNKHNITGTMNGIPFVEYCLTTSIPVSYNTSVIQVGKKHLNKWLDISNSEANKEIYCSFSDNKSFVTKVYYSFDIQDIIDEFEKVQSAWSDHMFKKLKLAMHQYSSCLEMNKTFKIDIENIVKEIK